jgi:hypothetical protein
MRKVPGNAVISIHGVSRFISVAMAAIGVSFFAALPDGAARAQNSVQPSSQPRAVASSPTGNTLAKKPATARIKEPVTAAACQGAMKPGKPYFIEFRSRTAASYGHTFVFYGRLGGGNRFAGFQVAGLHPAGDSPVTYVTGLMVPVPAETGVSDGDLDEQYLTARYCVTLGEAEFRRAVAYIKLLQAEKKVWHGSSYNCNAFAGDIAKFIGLKTPASALVYPEVFINSLRSLNNGGQELPNVPYIEWGMKPPADIIKANKLAESRK